MRISRAPFGDIDVLWRIHHALVLLLTDWASVEAFYAADGTSLLVSLLFRHRRDTQHTREAMALVERLIRVGHIELVLQVMCGLRCRSQT